VGLLFRWKYLRRYDFSRLLVRCNRYDFSRLNNPNSAATQALLSIVRGGYRPFQVVALGSPEAQPTPVPLLHDRGLVDGHAAAYVCRDFACQAPVKEPDKLQAQLALR